MVIANACRVSVHEGVISFYSRYVRNYKCFAAARTDLEGEFKTYVRTKDSVETNYWKRFAHRSLLKRNSGQLKCWDVYNDIIGGKITGFDDSLMVGRETKKQKSQNGDCIA